MIYAVITNELGLFGATAVLVAYLLFIYRGFKTAALARDSFSTLLAVGLSTVFGLQVFVIVGGVTRVIPLTGVTLPFISYGGASIVANFVLLALLLLVSDRSRRPVSDDEHPDPEPVRRDRDPVRAPDRLDDPVDGDRRHGPQQQPAQQPDPDHGAEGQARADPGRQRRDAGPLGPPAQDGLLGRTYPLGGLFAQPVGYSNRPAGSRPVSSSPGRELEASRRAGLGLRPSWWDPEVGDDLYTMLDTNAQRWPSRNWPDGPGRWSLGSPDGRGAGDVLQPDVQQQPPNKPCIDACQLNRATQGHIPGLDVQGGDRHGGDRQRQVHA